jgi:precorrin-6x reductase
MSVQKGTGFYHVQNFESNRIFRVQVVASTAANNVFEDLLGPTETAPFTGKIASPAANDLIAQQRMDAVVRAITPLAIAVGLKITTTTHTADTLVLEFETARSGMQNGSVSDITDTYGLAGQTPKTKPGIQTLLTNMLGAKSLDGGTTLLFAVNPSLSDGTASTAPVITALTASVI